MQLPLVESLLEVIDSSPENWLTFYNYDLWVLCLHWIYLTLTTIDKTEWRTIEKVRDKTWGQSYKFYSLFYTFSIYKVKKLDLVIKTFVF